MASTATRLVVLLALPISLMQAQAMGAHVTHTDIGLANFPKPIGYGILIEQPIGHSGLQWQFAFDAAFGRNVYQGSPCTGFVNPEAQECTIQSLHAKASTQAAGFGLRLPILRGRRAALSLIGNLGLQRLSTTIRDGTSTEVASNWRMMYRPEAGGEFRVKPSKEKPLWLTAGYAIGQSRPLRNHVIADGFDPFAVALDSKRAWVGVAVGIDPTATTRRRR